MNRHVCLVAVQLTNTLFLKIFMINGLNFETTVIYKPITLQDQGLNQNRSVRLWTYLFLVLSHMTDIQIINYDNDIP